MNMLIEDIVQDIIKNNSELKQIFNPKDFWQHREMLIEFPRWIRNHYKLWEIKNGEHPDDISARIVTRLKEVIKAP